MENNDRFNYTYSASQQQEVENIRKKYLPKQEDKLDQLRKLHNSATHKATAWSIALGTVGTLIMGIGMSFAMSNLGEILGSYRDLAMVFGIIIGVIGMAILALAYPVYNHVLKKERARIAPEILRLTDELLK